MHRISLEKHQGHGEERSEKGALSARIVRGGSDTPWTPDDLHCGHDLLEVELLFSVPRCVISELGTGETLKSARVAVQSARCTERLEGGQDLDIMRDTVR